MAKASAGSKKAATKNENCFEIAVTNLKNVSNRKSQQKKKTNLNFAVEILKTMSNRRLK